MDTSISLFKFFSTQCHSQQHQQLKKKDFQRFVLIPIYFTLSSSFWFYLKTACRSNVEENCHFLSNGGIPPRISTGCSRWHWIFYDSGHTNRRSFAYQNRKFYLCCRVLPSRKSLGHIRIEQQDLSLVCRGNTEITKIVICSQNSRSNFHSSKLN